VFDHEVKHLSGAVKFDGDPVASAKRPVVADVAERHRDRKLNPCPHGLEELQSRYQNNGRVVSVICETSEISASQRLHSDLQPRQKDY
jgi:hypothetical protein